MNIAKRLKSLLGKTLLYSIPVLAVALNARAQTSSTDGSTPLGLAPGAPLGSYPLSGFENLNLFNGHLNFRLVLLSLQGRGETRVPVTLPIETKWRVQHVTVPQQTGNPLHYYYPTPDWWSIRRFYVPALMVGRYSGEGLGCPGYPNVSTRTLTRLTFTTPEGTEYELRDQLTDGEPSADCAYLTQGKNRGRVFVTADGTAATFWSDADISDSLNPDWRTLYPSGVLALRDGTRYRIQDGLVTLLQDRNGNRFTFTYDATKRVTEIRDGLKRAVTVTYSTNLDTLVFKGFGGVAATVQVHYAALGSLLRTGFSLQTYQQLFPSLNGSSVQFNPVLVSRVVLPNGREYAFRYNSFGELAEVLLPAGGAIQYDYSGGVIQAGSVPEEKAVFRWLSERREFPTQNGAQGSQGGKTVYTRSGIGPITVTTNHYDASGARLAQERHTFQGSPEGSFWKTPNSYPAWQDSRETLSEALNATATEVWRKTEMAWQQGRTVSWWGGGSASSPPADPRLTQTLHRLLDNGYNLVAKTTYSYDSFNNVTEIREHDYGTSGTPTTHPRRRTQTAYVTTNTVDSVARNYTENTSAAPIHIRDLVAERWVYDVNPSTGTQTLVSRVRYNYDRYDATSGHAALVARPTIAQHSSRDGVQQAYLPRHTTSYKTRGNVTSTERWLNTGGTWIADYAQYDVAGNAVKILDPRGYATLYDFADDFGAPNGEARTNSPPADLGPDQAFAFVRRVTNPVGHESWTQYDYALGRAVDEEDANTRVQRTAYDVLGRLRQRDFPDGGQVRLYYSDIDATASDGGAPVFPGSQTALPLKQRAYTRIDTGMDRSDLAVFDGFGRLLMGGVSSNAAGNLDWTRSEHHERCGVLRTSNPRSLTASPADPAASNFTRWTTSSYDALCRVTRTTTPDGQFVTFDYRGNQTTVTDQLLNPRRTVRDALGRVSSVMEPNETTGSLTVNSYTTTYAYDALDHLTGVVQGAQSRSFVYDTLGRLTQETHPEWGPATSASGTASCLYDAASNLTRRTDARGVVTDWTGYDGLNRPSGKTYSDATPAVGFTYDSTSSTNGKGRLTGMTDGAGSASCQYDAMGRISSIVRTTAPRPAVTANYTYNHLGGIKKAAWPGIYDYAGAPLAIWWSYDYQGRQTSAWWSNHPSGGPGGTAWQQMVTGYTMVYNATSAQETTSFGNGTVETVTYDQRLQPTARTVPGVLNLAASFSGPSGRNNGNVFQVTDTYETNGNFTYTYDYLNRLETSSGPGPVLLEMTYDRWGNRSQAATGAGPHKPLSFLTGSYSKNRISSSGYTYDNAGNLTAEPADAWTGRGAMTYQYDAESRIKSTGGAATASYAYDGHGRRVKKTAGGQTRYYDYDPLGHPVWEYTTLWETFNLYFNGKLVFTNTAAMNPSTVWLHTDHLGTVRVKSNASGQAIAGTRLHYHPFGERVNAKTDPVKYEFTGKERDDDTRLDSFGARYYASTLGRFTRVDPVRVSTARLMDPQQLNLYAYTRNNPLRYIDPTGEILTVSGDIAKAQDQLCYILGTGHCETRIAYDQDTNTITVDLNGIDLSLNEGALLLDQLVGSRNVYNLNIGDTLLTEGGMISMKDRATMNLDRNPDWRYGRGKSPQHLPPYGVDAQVGIHPGIAARMMDTRSRPILMWAIVFHELAEAYSKVDLGKPYLVRGPDGKVFETLGAHVDAVSRELKLRTQRPSVATTGQAGDSRIRRILIREPK